MTDFYDDSFNRDIKNILNFVNSSIFQTMQETIKYQKQYQMIIDSSTLYSRQLSILQNIVDQLYFESEPINSIKSLINNLYTYSSHEVIAIDISEDTANKIIDFPESVQDAPIEIKNDTSLNSSSSVDIKTILFNIVASIILPVAIASATPDYSDQLNAISSDNEIIKEQNEEKIEIKRLQIYLQNNPDGKPISDKAQEIIDEINGYFED